MSNTSFNATTERPGTPRGSLSFVPWRTVVPLAVVLAYADGFGVISLRGAAGSIKRTQEPFLAWLGESTLALPVFVLAVLGALALATRKSKTVKATVLLIVAAGTLVGIGELAASSAYDYHLQTSQAQVSGSMDAMNALDAMNAMDVADAMNAKAQQDHGSLVLQERAVGLGSGIILLTNLALVSWVAAILRGRLDFSKARQ